MRRKKLEGSGYEIALSSMRSEFPIVTKVSLFSTQTGRGKLTFGKQCYIGNFHDDKMLGPGTYVFPNGCQQHGEYVITEEELEDDKNKAPDVQDESEAKRKRSHTKQLKFKWISHEGSQAPITVVRKETLIN